jgi:hypothetical protein
MADWTRGEVDDLTDLKLVFFQRDSPTLERRRTHPFWGSASPNGANIAAKSALALKNPRFAHSPQPHKNNS